jgi:hypothetical protein
MSKVKNQSSALNGITTFILVTLIMVGVVTAITFAGFGIYEIFN